MSDRNEEEEDDDDILLYDSSDDGASPGPSDDEDDDFVFLDLVKKEKARTKRSVLGKRRRTCPGDSPSLLMSEDVSSGDEDSLLPSPLRPSPRDLKQELRDLERGSSDGSDRSDTAPAKKKKRTGAALKRYAAELREYRSLLRAISNKAYRRYRSEELGSYPPAIDWSLGFRHCWPWEGYHDQAPKREREEVEVQQPLREDFPEVRSIATEEPWTQVPLASLSSAGNASSASNSSSRSSAASHVDKEPSDERAEDGFMEDVRGEVGNMVVRTFQAALSSDSRAQELSESSASVQATASVVTEALEEVLKGSLMLRGLVGPADMLSSKVAGDWETVLNAARCLGFPERVIERTRLRLYADRNTEELMQLSCFTELQWLPVPGGLRCNRFRSDFVRKPRGPNKKKALVRPDSDSESPSEEEEEED